ncbi:hypothetical protein GCM10010307_20640 [Streptomyces vastus]|uniref:Uncharacterized protein n=1 Tax=Streptomyces vastus TaxID=285451 RepID=A0ABP6CZB0_9ACTN
MGRSGRNPRSPAAKVIPPSSQPDTSQKSWHYLIITGACPTGERATLASDIHIESVYLHRK